MVLTTALLAVATAFIAVPLKRTRERQMIDAARDELPRLFAALEAYRAVHYRFPDRLGELASAGYAAPHSIVVCRYEHITDVRNFDDHIEVVMHHRASARAIEARYPARGAVHEIDSGSSCELARTAVAR